MKKAIKIISKLFVLLIGFFILFNLIGFGYAYIAPKLDIQSANAFSVYDNQGKLVFQVMVMILG